MQFDGLLTDLTCVMMFTTAALHLSRKSCKCTAISIHEYKYKVWFFYTVTHRTTASSLHSTYPRIRFVYHLSKVDCCL